MVLVLAYFRFVLMVVPIAFSPEILVKTHEIVGTLEHWEFSSRSLKNLLPRSNLTTQNSLDIGYN